MSERVVCNVAVGLWYGRGQARLAESLRDQDCDIELWNDWPATPHSVVPYRFKVDALLWARRNGYRYGAWMDASCWVVRSLEPLWEQTQRDGYFLGAEGWTVGRWCSERVLELLGKTREEADAMTLVEGKIMAFDFHSELANRFLDTWNHYADIGVFNGSWDDHRHDITAAGFIVAEMGLSLTPNTVCLTKECHPDTYVRASGM